MHSTQSLSAVKDTATAKHAPLARSESAADDEDQLLNVSTELEPASPGETTDPESKPEAAVQLQHQQQLRCLKDWWKKTWCAFVHERFGVLIHLWTRIHRPMTFFEAIDLAIRDNESVTDRSLLLASVLGRELSAATAERVMSEMDLDRSGSVDKDEAERWWVRYSDDLRSFDEAWEKASSSQASTDHELQDECISAGGVSTLIRTLLKPPTGLADDAVAAVEIWWENQPKDVKGTVTINIDCQGGAAEQEEKKTEFGLRFFEYDGRVYVLDVEPRSITSEWLRMTRPKGCPADLRGLRVMKYGSNSSPTLAELKKFNENPKEPPVLKCPSSQGEGAFVLTLKRDEIVEWWNHCSGNEGTPAPRSKRHLLEELVHSNSADGLFLLHGERAFANKSSLGDPAEQAQSDHAHGTFSLLLKQWEFLHAGLDDRVPLRDRLEDTEDGSILVRYAVAERTRLSELTEGMPPQSAEDRSPDEPFIPGVVRLLLKPTKLGIERAIKQLAKVNHGNVDESVVKGWFERHCIRGEWAFQKAWANVLQHPKTPRDDAEGFLVRGGSNSVRRTAEQKQSMQRLVEMMLGGERIPTEEQTNQGAYQSPRDLAEVVNACTVPSHDRSGFPAEGSKNPNDDLMHLVKGDGLDELDRGQLIGKYRDVCETETDAAATYCTYNLTVMVWEGENITATPSDPYVKCKLVYDGLRALRELIAAKAFNKIIKDRAKSYEDAAESRESVRQAIASEDADPWAHLRVLAGDLNIEVADQIFERAKRMHEQKPKPTCQKDQTRPQRRENIHPMWEDELHLCLPPMEEGWRDPLFAQIEFESCRLEVSCWDSNKMRDTQISQVTWPAQDSELNVLSVGNIQSSASTFAEPTT